MISQQAKIRLLRGFGYLGVSFNGLLVPLLIYQMTHSTLMAGLSLVIEWVPKLAAYIFGGALASSWTGRGTHLRLDVFRVLALCGLGAAALGWAPWWVVAVSASVYQSTNAISNILFENLVSAWWPELTKAEGHASLVKADFDASVLASVLLMLIAPPAALLMLALIGQLVTLGLVLKWVKSIHPAQRPKPFSLGEVVQSTWTAGKRLSPELTMLALLSLAVWLPAATFVSGLPFFISYAFPGYTVDANKVAWVALTRTISSLGLIQAQRLALTRWPGSEQYFAVGSIALIIGAGLVAALGSGASTIVALLGVSWASLLYTPWSRTLRQALLPTELELRLPLTGLLLSVEAGSFLLGALLLAISHNNIPLLCGLTLAPLAVILPLWLWVRQRGSHTAKLVPEPQA